MLNFFKKIWFSVKTAYAVLTEKVQLFALRVKNFVKRAHYKIRYALVSFKVLKHRFKFALYRFLVRIELYLRRLFLPITDRLWLFKIFRFKFFHACSYAISLKLIDALNALKRRSPRTILVCKTPLVPLRGLKGVGLQHPNHKIIPGEVRESLVRMDAVFVFAERLIEQYKNNVKNIRFQLCIRFINFSPKTIFTSTEYPGIVCTDVDIPAWFSFDQILKKFPFISDMVGFKTMTSEGRVEFLVFVSFSEGVPIPADFTPSALQNFLADPDSVLVPKEYDFVKMPRDCFGSETGSVEFITINKPFNDRGESAAWELLEPYFDNSDQVRNIVDVSSFIINYSFLNIFSFGSRLGDLFLFLNANNADFTDPYAYFPRAGN